MATITQPLSSGALAAIAMVVVVVNGFLLAVSAEAVPPQIPALQWEERSDWINVKTDTAPAAIGDGQADDTVAIQNALTGVRDGTVLYFPPGTYRITAALLLKNFSGTAPNGEPVMERVFFKEAPADAALAKLSRTLDDLRRLGETDLRLNHPAPPRPQAIHPQSTSNAAVAVERWDAFEASLSAANSYANPKGDWVLIYRREDQGD